MTYAKDKGTRAETALAGYLTAELGVECVRRTMMGGGNDCGDVRMLGVPVMLEVKNFRSLRLSKWQDEVQRQCVSAVVPYGVCVWSPPGAGPKSIDRWVAFEWAETCVGPWRIRGSAYVGPLTRFWTAASAHWSETDEALYLGPATPDLDGHARARPLRAWVTAVQEMIAIAR